MIELLENLQFWQWWAFAGALVVVETLLPSGILYGVALAAFLVGVAMAGDLEMVAGWQGQVGGFAGLAVIFGWIGRGFRNRMLAPRSADAEIDSRPSVPLKPPAPTSSPAQPQAAPVAAKPAAKPAAAAAKVKPAPKPGPAPAAKKPPLDLKKPAPAAAKPAAKPVVKKPAPAKKPASGAGPAEPPSDLIGGVYTIWTAIAGGTGSIKIKGKDYALVGPDMPGGSRIKVIAVKEKILKVEPADE